MVLTTEICDIKLKNPLISASGILDEHGYSMLRLLDSGTSAVTTKSIGMNEREGNLNPTVVEVEGGLINGMGLPNPGIDNFGDEIKIIKRERKEAKVIGSIFADTPENFSFLAKRMEGYGVCAVELNLSCPHAKGFGAEIGSNPENVLQITREVKKSVSIPVFVKLTPNVTSIVELAKACEEGRADAVVAINTVRAMKIDINAGMPVLNCKIGGLSGKSIKPIGVRCVYEIASEVELPVVGVGGIMSGEDAIEYMMAGAKVVQIGSAIYYRELDVFKKINNEIESFLDERNLELGDIVGMALKR